MSGRTHESQEMVTGESKAPWVMCLHAEQGLLEHTFCFYSMLCLDTSSPGSCFLFSPNRSSLFLHAKPHRSIHDNWHIELKTKLSPQHIWRSLDILVLWIQGKIIYQLTWIWFCFMFCLCVCSLTLFGGFIVILRQGLRLGLWPACLELMPPSPLKYWDYGLAPSCPAVSNTLNNLVSLLLQIQINGRKAGCSSISKDLGRGEKLAGQRSGRKLILMTRKRGGANVTITVQ